MNRVVFSIIPLLLLLSISCSEKGHIPETPESIMNNVDGNRYFDDLNQIAVDRTLRSPGHEKVKDLCARRLSELGYRVELDSYGTGVNVIGRIDGIDRSGEAVILSAHYDSKNSGCPGADDNASGVAGALEAARVLAKARYNRTLIIAFWDEEEKSLVKPRGLHGSRAYAARARLEGREVILAFVFEMIGYRSSKPNSQKFPAWMKKYFPAEMESVRKNRSRGDFICLTVNEEAREYAGIFTDYANSSSLPALTLNINRKIINKHEFRRSDHAAFWERGYSAMMIGDTINYRNKNYHCKGGRIDDVAKLDTAFARDTIRATAATMARILDIKNY